MKKQFALPFIVLAALALVMITALAQPGDRDPTWGDQGRTLTSFGEGDDTSTANVLMDNGKWVLSGWVNVYPGDFGAARYLPDGNLDLSFGDGGKVVTAFVDDPDLVDASWAVGERPNGGLFLQGETCDADYIVCELAVAAYLEDGTLDPSFGDDGLVTTDPGTAGTLAWPGRLIVHEDGSLTTGGVVFQDDDSVDWVMVRYNADGSLDDSFGEGGIAITDLDGYDDFLSDMLALPGDKILATGAFASPVSQTWAEPVVGVLARMNGDGSLDDTFGGGDGFITWESGGETTGALTSLITPDNQIMVFGFMGTPNGRDCFLRRFDFDGELDTSFGDGGQVTIDSGQDDDCREMALTPDNKLALAWGALPYEPEAQATAMTTRRDIALARRDIALSRLDGQNRQGAQAQSFASVLARYNRDGTPDSSFGLNGLRRYSETEEGVFYQLAVQPDGKFLVGSDILVDGFVDFAALRFLDSQTVPAHPGALDPTWGKDGLSIVNFTENDDTASAMVLESDGKVTMAGWVNGYPGDFGVTRLRPNGRLDPTFGEGGKVMTRFTDDPDQPNAAWAIGRRAGGGYVVSGDLCDADYLVCEWATAVYLPDGSLDTSFSGDGLVVTGIDDVFSVYAWPYRMVTQADGGVVIGGVVINNDDVVDIALRRYKADGTLDAAYGDNGIALHDFDDTSNYIESMRPVADDKILTTGGFGEAIDPFSYEIDKAFLAQFNADGSLDLAFGSDGLVTWDQNGERAKAEDLVVGPAGDIFVVGFVPLEDGGQNCAVWHFDMDGTQDLDFGVDGILRVDTGYDELCTSIDRLPDGKLVISGFIYPAAEESRSATVATRSRTGRLPGSTKRAADLGDSVDSLIARLNDDGTLDATFGTNGIVVYDVDGADNAAFVVAAQPDGKMVLAGDLTDPVSQSQSMYATRFLGDGPAAQVFAPIIGR